LLATIVSSLAPSPNSSLTFDVALSRGKSLFRKLYGKRWTYGLIGTMVDDKDWVLVESSGDIQHHFMKTGGSIDEMLEFWRDPIGGELVADIEEGWALTYLNAGAIEKLAADGKDVVSLNQDWTHLALLHNWAVEAVRANPRIETVGVVRATTFLAPSVESVWAGFNYDLRANLHLALEDPHLGWLWKGMLYSGVPPIADPSGAIPDFVLPGKTVALTLDLRDSRGKPVPSIAHTRPAPCPLCWGRRRGERAEAPCPGGCTFGDTGSLPDPDQLVFVPGTPIQYDPGVEAIYMLYGGDTSRSPRSLRVPTGYSLVEAWIRARVTGGTGGRPAGPPPGLRKFVTQLAKRLQPKWGTRAPVAPSDAEIARQFNAAAREDTGFRRATAASVKRVR
jgi:hypothetical protein